jgi:hypothetical protein
MKNPTAPSERLARFEREARAVTTLNPPNIVALYSIEDAGAVRFLTMERGRVSTGEATLTGRRPDKVVPDRVVKERLKYGPSGGGL